MTFLHDRSTPDLIRETVPAIGTLINMTTDPDSEERFDRLCHLVGEGIIGGIWVYARHEESDVIEASTDVLPEVVHALGIGTARYLNGRFSCPCQTTTDIATGINSPVHVLNRSELRQT